MLFSTIIHHITYEDYRCHSQNIEIEYLLTDSRQVFFPQNSLFFAINGQRNDGHFFIDDLYQKGIRNFIVEKKDFLIDKKYADANFVCVQNSIEALQQIAIVHRNQFSFPIISITGSNGKTIIKEWLSELLSADFSVIKSPKSYNSQIGVPLSVWNMKQYHHFGIFEAGISKPNEMIHLAKIIQPDIGIFGNIGSAHDEGFENRTQKIEEKLQLFTNAKQIIFCGDHTEIKNIVQKKLPNITKISWGTQNKAVEFYFEYEILPQKTIINIENKDKKYTLETHFSDKASLENLSHCLVFLYTQTKFSTEKINLLIQHLQAVSMRLSLKKGINECYLIDDSYNNDVAGLHLALDFLQNQPQKKENILILSDILESNLDNQNLYFSIAALIKNAKINTFIGIGKAIKNAQKCFQLIEKTFFFENTDDFLMTNIHQNFTQSLILVKGARTFQFEKIIQQLQQKTHRTILEVNLEALVHNLNFYKSLLQKNTKIMVMVKAFAYGAGRIEVAHLLQNQRVDYLAVAYADEGVDLRNNGIKLPIMVMSPSEDTFEQLFQYQLEPEIYSFKILKSFLMFAKNKNWKDFKIHIKLDTGMNRLGFLVDEVKVLAEYLSKNMPLEASVASVFSHLAASDDEKYNEFSYQQIENFKFGTNILENILGYSFLKHLSNSPAIVRFPEAHFDMVRLGIGLYGIETNAIFQDKLVPIATLKTTISQIKIVKKGQSVGYSCSEIMEKDTKIGVINIGYADGFNRLLSNGVGKVFVNGKITKTLGRICMDMSMIDLNEINAKEGDEVIIFGQEISIQEVAEAIKTIPYEILTSVGERVKRVFFKE